MGNPLSTLKNDCSLLVKFVRDRSNKTTLKSALPLLQLISCLQDTGCNPFRLDGKIMDEDNRFEVECETNKRALGELCACQIMQAFFFQNWSRAIEVFEVLTSKHRRVFQRFKARFLHIPTIVYAETAYFALADLRPSCTRKARRILREVGRYSAQDGLAYVKILQAEYDMNLEHSDRNL